MCLTGTETQCMSDIKSIRGEPLGEMSCVCCAGVIVIGFCKIDECVDESLHTLYLLTFSCLYIGRPSNRISV